MEFELIKTTRSRCPKCLQACPGRVLRTLGETREVYLERDCPTHGTLSYRISSDARFYYYAQGAGDSGDCCCAPGACSAADDRVVGTIGKNALQPVGALFEKLSTCVALIEIVNSCNLSCPTCYADSPLEKSVDAVPLEELKDRILGVLERKGGIEILQLSGGEPTLHPQFFELLDWINNDSRIDYVLLNTNGILLARDDNFIQELKKRVRPNRFQVYLQYDGPDESVHQKLRGADLRDLKVEAIKRCGEISLPVTLAMTVVPENLSLLWDSIEFGLSFPHVRGIAFQPAFFSGRNSSGDAAETSRLNTADIIIHAVDASAGKLRFEDFTPLPCGDPNCATIGYLLKTPEGVRSISDFIDFTSVQGFLQDRIRYQLEDLHQCGCEVEPLGAMLKQFEMDASHTFRLFIKPFMDAWTWDEDRIDRCCTHVIRPDGKLDSFCRYYANFPEARARSGLNVLNARVA